MTQPSAYSSESLPFDDLFPDRRVMPGDHMGALPPTLAALNEKAHRCPKARRKPGATDLNGNRRVKRGRKMMSAPETREMSGKLIRAYLPVELAADYRITPAFKRVLAVLIADARRNSCASSEMSVSEISANAHTSVRTVQNAVKALSAPEFDLIEVEDRPITRDMNETNVYHLAVACFGERMPFERRLPQGGTGQRRTKPKPRRPTGQRAASSGPAGGAKKCGVNNSSLSKIETPTATTPRGAKAGEGRRKRSATGRVCDDSDRSPGFVRENLKPSPLPIPNLSPDDERCLKAGLAVIRPDRHRGRSAPDTPLEIFAAVDRLRREYIPNFDESEWRRHLRRHRARAYLAVVEALLMASVRAGTDRRVMSLARYLGGILKPDETDPRTSVSRILAEYGRKIEPRLPVMTID